MTAVLSPTYSPKFPLFSFYHVSFLSLLSFTLINDINITHKSSYSSLSLLLLSWLLKVFIYMDGKWKLSKKDCSTSHASSSKSSFTRSFSTKSTSTKSPLLQKSSSTKCPLPRSSSYKGGSSISQKCSSMAKEQKARFYIMRRCVAMLVCWHKHGDSWETRLLLSARWIDLGVLWNYSNIFTFPSEAFYFLDSDVITTEKCFQLLHNVRKIIL